MRSKGRWELKEWGGGGYISVQASPARPGGECWAGPETELVETEIDFEGVLTAGFVLVQAWEGGAGGVCPCVGGGAVLLPCLPRLQGRCESTGHLWGAADGLLCGVCNRPGD